MIVVGVVAPLVVVALALPIDADPHGAPPASLSAQASTPAGKKQKPKKAKVDKPAPDEAADEDAPAVEEPTGRFVWKQHPSWRYGKVFRIDLQGKFQEDFHSSYDNAPVETAELHRNRIGVQGMAFKYIEYEVERELTEKEVDVGKTPKSPWKDVYVRLTYFKRAQVQAGKFKLPFGLDQLTGVTHNDFVYRSLGANYLDPARDVGVMVTGRVLNKSARYSAGGFIHDGDNATSQKIQGGDATFAGRFTLAPFKRSKNVWSKLELGSALAMTKVTDDSFQPNGLRGRTIMTQDYFYEPVYVKGGRQRWEADLDWTSGPASFRTEYTHVTDERLKQGFADQDLPNARYQAWYVSGTYVVTGENKKRPVKPSEDFMTGGGMGAIEVALRYERLWRDSVGGTDQPFANPRAETILLSDNHALTIGVNWTLNRFIKIQVNGIREHLGDPQVSPVPDSSTFWSRVLRLQFVI